MVAQLRPEQVTYDPRSGRYRSEFGGFLSAVDVRSVVEGEVNRLNTRLQTINDALLTNAIPLSLWEEAIAAQVKQSHLRVTALGVGGDEALRRSPLARRYFGVAGRNLRDVYASIRRLGDRIENGDLTEAQIRDRVNRLGNTVIPAHGRAQLLTRIAQQGHNEGARRLDVNVKNHCAQCPGHQRLDWVPIDQIVPVGHACDCGGYCHCTVRTRFNPKLAISQLGETSIADIMKQSEQNQEAEQEAFRDGSS